MKKSKRYDTSHFIEDQYEPGSNNQVLKNKLGITNPDEMDKSEKKEQLHAMDELTDLFNRDYRFTASDICKMHKMWLGNIYEWAGKNRQGKGGKNAGYFNGSASRIAASGFQGYDWQGNDGIY